MRHLNENEQLLERLMHEVSELPRTRGACKRVVINGMHIMCAANYNADGTFRSHRFVVDGKSMKGTDLWTAVRA